ncbi:MAG TPA: hypothetical protein DIT13_09380 [Verrucomicrobiales bacterium]|nr:hypothetical protein [Verrucomicrobiales bacterium]HRJ07888.1 TIGR02597 family protein [Prosthecobacter sp.]HRK15327.1 TIGR02597 family protein [Prosthecobacter sp.]
MKKLLNMAIFGVLAATGLLQAQVTSPIMGFLTLHLQEGTNFIGFALLPTMEMQSSFNISPTDRKIVFLQGGPNLALADNQFNPGPLATHAVEIVSSGAGQGFTTIVTATLSTGNQLTLQEEVPAGVADGASLKVWRLWTLADVFGADNSAGLAGGETPGQADLILLPNGTGFDKYFYSTGGAQGVGWRQVDGGTTDQADVPVFVSEGAAIIARAAKSVVVIGQVKPGVTKVSLQTGNNYVANLCPVNAAGEGASVEGRTLGNSGLAEGMAGGTASSLADLVLLWNGSGYDQYFNSTGGPLGAGWRKVGAGSTDQSSVPLPDGAYIILRRGAPVMITLNQGSF